MRGFFSSPPPPPSPLERLRVVLAPFASSSTASFMLRLAVTAYGALLCASLLSARAAFGARGVGGGRCPGEYERGRWRRGTGDVESRDAPAPKARMVGHETPR